MHELLRTGKLLATTTAIADYLTYTPGGRGGGGWGALGYFLGGYVPPARDFKLAPRSKKKFP